MVVTFKKPEKPVETVQMEPQKQDSKPASKPAKKTVKAKTSKSKSVPYTKSPPKNGSHNNISPFSFMVPPELLERFREHCRKVGAMRGEVARRALIAYLDEAEKK